MLATPIWRQLSGHRYVAGRCRSRSAASQRQPICVSAQSGEAWTSAGETDRPRKRVGEGNSTWTDKAWGMGEGEDYLTDLGKRSSSMRIDMGARAGMIDPLFTGDFLGKQADIASGELRNEELRSFDNIVGDYYVPPAFMEAVSMHLIKNVLADENQLGWKTPLILGVWGEKGCGKSFNIELACKKLKVNAIVMSAGELEDVRAGRPGQLIRERYRKAGLTMKNGGVFSCLIINDVDAGIGRFRDTQVTVNNQTVVGTLMNLCDHPQKCSLGESWMEDQSLRRVPIIITANDLSTIYAPLLRDGRMDKFYWSPTREDKIEMIYTLYRDDNVSRQDVSELFDRFPKQPLDFFGAIRARQFDREILQWRDTECEGDPAKVGQAIQALIRGKVDALPTFEELSRQGTIAKLHEAGEDLEREQEMVNQFKLSNDYMKVMKPVMGGGIGIGR